MLGSGVLKPHKILSPWTVERVRAEALKHNTLFAFMNNAWPAYFKACQIDVWRPGFLTEITNHMEKQS